jgi:hypothetical protein
MQQIFNKGYLPDGLHNMFLEQELIQDGELIFWTINALLPNESRRSFDSG